MLMGGNSLTQPVEKKLYILHETWSQLPRYLCHSALPGGDSHSQEPQSMVRSHHPAQLDSAQAILELVHTI